MEEELELAERVRALPPGVRSRISMYFDWEDVLVTRLWERYNRASNMLRLELSHAQWGITRESDEVLNTLRTGHLIRGISQSWAHQMVHAKHINALTKNFHLDMLRHKRELVKYRELFKRS